MGIMNSWKKNEKNVVKNTDQITIKVIRKEWIKVIIWRNTKKELNYKSSKIRKESWSKKKKMIKMKEGKMNKMVACGCKGAGREWLMKKK